MEGKVVAVGKGKVMEDGKLHPVDVKVGRSDPLRKIRRHGVKIDGEEHLIMREDDILGVIEK